ncbi:MAG: CBS domain-containing protein [Xanthobacteraceae bacterium]|nr:CBS domain-containing protein [Xanthobacteraceae bacterium]MBX3548687.1 CBS domain-containing protein [Xanthobacteraceae bacterium]MCW5678563.1 CBS domain-containing protein [Xanthobacteraceae bacterium]
MKVNEVMTTEVKIADPSRTIQDAAKLMDQTDCGSLPVGEGDRLVGMITDRDIVIRAVAAGLPADTPIRDVMTKEMKYCFENDEVEDVAENMGDIQMRRLPVLNSKKRIVGIVSIGDLARSDDECAGEALASIAQPGNGRAAA